jgi:hypothetical protein
MELYRECFKIVEALKLASREDLIVLKKLRNSSQDKVDIENLSHEQD